MVSSDNIYIYIWLLVVFVSLETLITNRGTFMSERIGRFARSQQASAYMRCTALLCSVLGLQ